MSSPKPISGSLSNQPAATPSSAPEFEAGPDAGLFAHEEGPGFHHEARFYARKYRHVAGVDEAGRGPLAGPVVAAAVILDPARIPQGVNDSKKLTVKKREKLFEEILHTAHVSWSSASAREIDAVNIRQATLNAMYRAVLGLPVSADHVLVDGRDVPFPLVNSGTAIVKGDAISQSIAAASIIAKVLRDRMMQRAALYYPQYGFCSNKGYGSSTHLDAINRHGPCPLHRFSFAPIKNMTA